MKERIIDALNQLPEEVKVTVILRLVMGLCDVINIVGQEFKNKEQEIEQLRKKVEELQEENEIRKEIMKEHGIVLRKDYEFMITEGR